MGSLVEKFRGRTLDPDCLGLNPDSAPAKLPDSGQVTWPISVSTNPIWKKKLGVGVGELMLFGFQGLY